MKKNTTLAPAVLAPHGIDLNAPGGIEALLEHHRLTFGDAVMQDDGAGAGGDGAGAGGDGSGSASGDGSGEGSGDGKDGTDGQLGPNGQKALQTERDARKTAEKLANERAARITELENATKSDEEKRSERFQQLETTEREQSATITQQQGIIDRYRVAAAKGLDLEAAERLRGTTKAELEKDADSWIAKWGNTGGAQQVPGAGARGSDRVQSSPGIGTLRAGYDEKK
ncbi:Uncharacterised protein [Arthrobacter agilis]|uniref:hypothetical protein n=1 Tax=Arthrobacter agilis TaxID=37921 RepID=UPI000F701A0D|nr:hypothetical protein [Arthrobacter agilis]VDR32538.1 Uncharacterised protein [Arthrobacter agilis]